MRDVVEETIELKLQNNGKPGNWYVHDGSEFFIRVVHEPEIGNVVIRAVHWPTKTVYKHDGANEKYTRAHWAKMEDVLHYNIKMPEPIDAVAVTL